MGHIWTLCALLACLRVSFQQHFARSNLPDTAFTVPGPAGLTNDYSLNKVYLLNSILDLKWFTNFTSYSVYLWQQELPGGAASAAEGSIYSKSDSDPEEGGFSWQVETESLDLSDSNVFFMVLGPSDDVSQSATSHYFNITADAANIPSSQSSSAAIISSTTASSSTSSVTSASTTTGASTSASTNTAASTTSPASPSSSGSTSEGAKIGLGVGLGIGIPIILLLAGLLFLKIRKEHKPLRMQPETYEQGPPAYPKMMPQSSPYASKQQVVPQMNSGVYYPHELAASPS